MDPGEGRNGVCEDCISREKREREKKKESTGEDAGGRRRAEGGERRGGEGEGVFLNGADGK